MDFKKLKERSYCKYCSPRKKNDIDRSIIGFTICPIALMLDNNKALKFITGKFKKYRVTSYNYIIDFNSKVHVDIDEKYRAWSTGNPEFDSERITIAIFEKQDGDNAYITDNQYKTLLILVMELSKKYNLDVDKTDLIIDKYYSKSKSTILIQRGLHLYDENIAKSLGEFHEIIRKLNQLKQDVKFNINY